MLSKCQTRILVVDDDRITRLMVRKMLESNNYEVFEAENGVKALDTFNACCPQLVILDVVMPEMDGYTTCRKIREKADLLEIPVIMMTGLDDIESVRKSLDAGASDFISKPINLPLFELRVENALNARQMHGELRAQRTRLEQAQQLARLGSWEIQAGSDTVECSDELVKLLGAQQASKHMVVADFIEFAHPADRDAVRTHIENALVHNIPYQLEHRVSRGDGSVIYVLQHTEIIRDREGNASSVVGTLQDITEIKQSQALIHRQKYYDPLTELPNRQLFTERLLKHLAVPHKDNEIVAIYLVMIDQVTKLSETLGYRATDAVIVKYAELLKEIETDNLVVARFNDNTFALSLAGINNFSDVPRLAAHVLALSDTMLSISTHNIHITTSIGISIYPVDNGTPEGVISGAENAMNRAYKAGGNQYLFYSEQLNRQAQHRLELEDELRHALSNDEFRVLYQPQVNVSLGRVTGMEALLCWEHPQRGTIPTEEFIDVAEETGLIIPISKLALEQACEQTKQWLDSETGKLKLGINLSIKQFVNNNIYAEIMEVLDATGLPASQLDLEITESMAASNARDIADTLQRFRDHGISISIDDFGTGYSSLSYIQQLPVSVIKIDRSFVKDIGVNENGSLARTIIAMSKSLGLDVIAEGVETEAQRDMLVASGCPNIQGFLYSKPLAAHDFEAFVRRFNGLDELKASSS